MNEMMFTPKNEKAVSIFMCSVLSTEDNTGDEIEWSFG